MMNDSKKALVTGAGGFIGSHLVKRLKKEGCWVRGVDLKYPEFAPTEADDFVMGDLRDPQLCIPFLKTFMVIARNEVTKQSRTQAQ